MSESVVCMKLVSGEEIICKLVNEEENHVIISRPLAVQLQQTREGIRAGLIPFVHLTQDKDLVVSKSAIIANYLPDMEVERGYLSQISGIQLT